jgi:glycyl-tRNA synthetase alpha chain
MGTGLGSLAGRHGNQPVHLFPAGGQFGLPARERELTYGLERLAMYIQNVDDYRQLRWNDTTLYEELFFNREVEYSHYNFDGADTAMLFERFTKSEAECNALIAKKLVYPAYDELLKCSHTFNLLDARGVISVTERQAYIGRIRNLARLCATTYMDKFGEDKA